MENGAVLDVRRLQFSYKGRPALFGVTFTVQERSIHGFVGPNGAGKTTTLKILATLLKPQGGSVRIFDRDVVRDYKEVRQKLGFMPDHLGMYPQMTVFEYLDFFAAAYGMSTPERNKVIDEVLTLTDMEGRKDDFIRTLSRGMQQRVSLARVLAHDPKLLLLDEPASGLDPRGRIELMEILKELRRMGKTVFISSHILTELTTLCDSITIIDRGRTKYSGPMDALLAQGGDVVEYILTLAQEHPATEEALRELQGVTDVRRMEDGPSYLVTFNRQTLDVNQVLKLVLETGAQVVSLRLNVRHLNEAFMDLTEPGVPT